MINPETLPKSKEKDLFKVYMEAFNTGTLTNDKYVDMAKYERKMEAIRSGETVATDDHYDPNKDLESELRLIMHILTQYRSDDSFVSPQQPSERPIGEHRLRLRLSLIAPNWRNCARYQPGMRSFSERLK